MVCDYFFYFMNDFQVLICFFFTSESLDRMPPQVYPVSQSNNPYDHLDVGNGDVKSNPQFQTVDVLWMKGKFHYEPLVPIEYSQNDIDILQEYMDKRNLPPSFFAVSPSHSDPVTQSTQHCVSSPSKPAAKLMQRCVLPPFTSPAKSTQHAISSSSSNSAAKSTQHRISSPSTSTTAKSTQRSISSSSSSSSSAILNQHSSVTSTVQPKHDVFQHSSPNSASPKLQRPLASSKQILFPFILTESKKSSNISSLSTRFQDESSFSRPRPEIQPSSFRSTMDINALHIGNTQPSSMHFVKPIRELEKEPPAKRPCLDLTGNSGNSSREESIHFVDDEDVSVIEPNVRNPGTIFLDLTHDEDPNDDLPQLELGASKREIQENMKMVLHSLLKHHFLSPIPSSSSAIQALLDEHYPRLACRVIETPIDEYICGPALFVFDLRKTSKSYVDHDMAFLADALADRRGPWKHTSRRGDQFIKLDDTLLNIWFNYRWYEKKDNSDNQRCAYHFMMPLLFVYTNLLVSLQVPCLELQRVLKRRTAAQVESTILARTHEYFHGL